MDRTLDGKFDTRMINSLISVGLIERTLDGNFDTRIINLLIPVGLI